MQRAQNSFRTGMLREIFKEDKEYLKILEEARANLVTYMDTSKLLKLFVEIIDKCDYVNFNDKRDRRIHKSNPVFKVSIDYNKTPKSIMDAARRKATVADAKTYIVRLALVGPFVTEIYKILKDNKEEYLKEALPDDATRESIKEYISTFFMIDASDDPEKPIYIRHLL
jgi:hypothetical protein